MGCQAQVSTVENGMQTDDVEMNEITKSIKSLMSNKLVKQTSQKSKKTSPQKLLDSSLKMLVSEKKKKNRKSMTQNLQHVMKSMIQTPQVEKDDIDSSKPDDNSSPYTSTPNLALRINLEPNSTGIQTVKKENSPSQVIGENESNNDYREQAN